MRAGDISCVLRASAMNYMVTGFTASLESAGFEAVETLTERFGYVEKLVRGDLAQVLGNSRWPANLKHRTRGLAQAEVNCQIARRGIADAA